MLPDDITNEEEETVEEEQLRDPREISILAPDIIDLPYEDALSALEKEFKESKWADPEDAADRVSAVTDVLHRYREDVKKPDPYTATDTSSLSKTLLDSEIDETSKLSEIEEWRKKSKQTLYNTDDFEKLKYAKDSERFIDSIATNARRTVISGDRGALLDGMARALEASLVPLAGVADMALDTNVRESLQEGIADFTNPERDDSWGAYIGQGVGVIGGFTVSALGGPKGVGAYLAASLLDQTKETYDVALESTGSEDAAKQAAINSIPFQVLDVVADRYIGGSLARILRGQKATIGAVTGAAAGVGGAVVELGGTGAVLAEATKDPTFFPTADQLLKTATVFGGIGGAVGAAQGFRAGRYEAGVEYMQKLFERQAKVRPEVQAEMQPDAPGVGNFFNSMTRDGEPNADTTTTTPDGEVSPVTPTPDAAKVEATARGVTDLGDASTTAIDPINPYTTAVKDNFVVEQQARVEAETRSAESETKAAKPDIEPPPIKDISDMGLEYSPIKDTDPTPRAIFSSVPKGFVGSPVIIDFLRKLGAKVFLTPSEVRDWGSYRFPVPNDPTHKVFLNRLLFKKAGKAEQTAAHELGHFVAEGLRKELQHDRSWLMEESKYDRDKRLADEPVYKKMFMYFHEGLRQYDNDSFANQATALSKMWRSGWNGTDAKYDAYRAQTTEIHADAFSAMFNNPEMVQQRFPDVYRAFMEGMNDFQDVRALWQQIRDVNADPEALVAFTGKLQDDANIAEAKIAKRVAIRDIANEKEAIKKGWSDAFSRVEQSIVNAYAPARHIVNTIKAISPNKESMLEGLYTALYSGKAAYRNLWAIFDAPLKMWLDDTVKLGLATTEEGTISLVNRYMIANRISNENNLVIQDIEANPLKYRAVLHILNERTPIRPELLDPNIAGDALVDNIAELHTDLHNLNPEILADIKKWAKDQDNIDLINVLDEENFNVRRYLGNPNETRESAKLTMQVLHNQLGDQKFAQLEQASKDYLDIISTPMLKSLEESGIVDDETLENFKLNKYFWVHFNVLKYFEEDARIPGTIRKQYGTIDAIGNVLTASDMKAKALFIRSEFQIAQNAAIEFARLSNFTTNVIEPKVAYYKAKEGKHFPVYESPYVTAQKLELKNPDKSYLIGTEAGKATLYEIDSPAFKRMFEEGPLASFPMVKQVANLANSLTQVLMARELKTILSVPFGVASRFYDIGNEAFQARVVGSYGLPFHTSRQLRELRARARESMRKFQRGEIDPLAEELLSQKVVGRFVHDDYGEANKRMNESFESGVYEILGEKIPGQEEAHWATKVNAWENRMIDKIPFAKKLKKQIELDELTTKATGYLIAREVSGKSKEVAARRAREYYGTPDPLGGGSDAAIINSLFLFGRAHINGMRNMFNQFKDAKGGFLAQYFYRKGVPRLLMSAPVMVPLITALFGEEEGEKAKAYLDKQSEYNKITKFNIPLGFRDEHGKFINMLAANASDIKGDWKSVTLQLPIAREVVAFDQLLTPAFRFIEDLLATGEISGTTIANDIVQSLKNAIGGQASPGILTGVHLGQLATGNNPTDFYRNKGILSKDVQEASTFVKKFYDYAVWALFNNAPAIFSKQWMADTTDSTSALDYFNYIPQLGPALGRFISVTNYGEYEKNVQLKERKQEFDSTIRLNMKADTKYLLNKYSKGHGLWSNISAEQRLNMSPKLRTEIIQYNTWKSKVYDPYFSLISDAIMKGDEAKAKELYKRVEEASASFRKYMNP